MLAWWLMLPDQCLVAVAPVRCMKPPLNGCGRCAGEVVVGREGLAGAAHLQLVSGVVQLRPEDAMVEAMLKGWRAQQTGRGGRGGTVAPRGGGGGRVLGV